MKTRRKFLACGAAALAAPLFHPVRLGAAPANDRINLGMIGMGRQAYFSNLKAFLAEKDVQVVAVCDVDSWRAEQGKLAIEEAYGKSAPSGTYKGCAVFRDFHELLARPDIDAVMVSTPDHWHVPVSLAAGQAGKDVSCEKPLTLGIREGRLLADAMKKMGRVFRTDSEFRSTTIFHRCCEIARNGKIGKLTRIDTGTPTEQLRDIPVAEVPVPPELDYKAWLGPARDAPYQVERVHPPKLLKARPGWMCIRDYCDGMVSNWGCHLNDIAQWAMGTDDTGPVAVKAEGSLFDKGLWNVLSRFEAWFRYANGVELHCRMDKPFIRIEGEKGWVQAIYGEPVIEASDESLLRYKAGEGEISLPLLSEKRNFLDCVRSRARTVADAEVGHRTTSLSHLAHAVIKAKAEGWVDWDPVKEIFPKHPDLDALASRAFWRPGTELKA